MSFSQKADNLTKNQIATKLCSKIVLQDKKLEISMPNSIIHLSKLVVDYAGEIGSLEPKFVQEPQGFYGQVSPFIPLLCARVEAIRKSIIKEGEFWRKKDEEKKGNDFPRSFQNYYAN